MIQHVIALTVIGKKNKYCMGMRPGFKFVFCHLPAVGLDQSKTYRTHVVQIRYSVKGLHFERFKEDKGQRMLMHSGSINSEK